jgi:hypothetical protein
MMGFRGTCVISWRQCEIDGVSAPLSALRIGSVWTWSGDLASLAAPVRAPRHLQARQRVMRMIHGAAPQDVQTPDDSGLWSPYFTLTDGTRRFPVELIERPNDAPLLMFVGDVPPRHTELWVHHIGDGARCLQKATDVAQNVLCFIAGTLIRTPTGVMRVEDLHEGSLIQTKDNGAQAVLWSGQRKITGARMYINPELRPIRLRASSILAGQPTHDLWLSPEHRVLLAGSAARDLFNVPEVLVRARDLLNDGSICTDYTLKSVTYHHLMLPSHNVVWANGVEVESFLPETGAIEVLPNAEYRRFEAVASDDVLDMAPARRILSLAEAEVLKFGLSPH